MAIELVSLSNSGREKKQKKKKVSRKGSIIAKYQGLTSIERAKQVALDASDNGRCWWIHDYIYRELTWRVKK